MFELTNLKNIKLPKVPNVKNTATAHFQRSKSDNIYNVDTVIINQAQTHKRAVSVQVERYPSGSTSLRGKAASSFFPLVPAGTAYLDLFCLDSRDNVTKWSLTGEVRMEQLETIISFSSFIWTRIFEFHKNYTVEPIKTWACTNTQCLHYLGHRGFMGNTKAISGSFWWSREHRTKGGHWVQYKPAVVWQPPYPTPLCFCSCFFFVIYLIGVHTIYSFPGDTFPNEVGRKPARHPLCRP